MATIVEHRVNYSETDQMGVVYHARYLVWLDVARTEFLRERGTTYRDVEAQGILLPVSDLAIRYGAPAQYDDLIRVRCWIEELRSRAITFGYTVEHAERDGSIAKATTTLVALDRDRHVVRIPDAIATRLRD